MTTFVPVCSVLTSMERTRSSQFEIANDLFSDLWGEKKTTVIYFKWKTNKNNVCLKQNKKKNSPQGLVSAPCQVSVYWTLRMLGRVRDR